MEFRKLRYFVVAAQEENFHRAAGRLFIAQPALTRHIKELETELGVTLFERSKRRVKLSAAGHLLLKHAHKILGDVDMAVVHMRQISEGNAGNLRISVNPTAMSFPAVAESFKSFRRNFDRIELDLHLITSRLALEAVRAGQIDLAFVHRDRRPRYEDLNAMPIARLPWVLVVPRSHPLADRDNLRLLDFKGDNFIWIPREQAPESYDELVPACIEAGLKLKIFQAAGDLKVYMSLVEAGMGVTFTSASIADEFRSPNVVFKTLREFSEPIELDLVWNGHIKSESVNQYLNIIRPLVERDNIESPGNDGRTARIRLIK